MKMCRGRQKAFLSLAKAPETQRTLRLLGKSIGLRHQYMVVPTAWILFRGHHCQIPRLYGAGTCSNVCQVGHGGCISGRTMKDST